jgi:dolichyl-phosphate beta-glucosyltransferase
MNKVSLALPCFNPSQDQWKRVEEFHNSLKKYSAIGLEFDLVIVDDGSPHWVEPHDSFRNAFTLVRLPKNHGKGFAVSEGLRTASKASTTSPAKNYSIFAFMDFDLPYSAEDLARMCASVDSGVDIAIGDRTCWWHVTDTKKISRQISHVIFRFLMRTMVIGGLHDTQCGVKAFKFRAAELIVKKAKLEGFLFDVEWLYIAARHRLSIQNLPVHSQPEHSSNRFFAFINGKIFMEFGRLLASIVSRSYDSLELIEWKNSQWTKLPR